MCVCVCVCVCVCARNILCIETVFAGGAETSSSIEAAQESLHSQAGHLGGFGSPTGFTSALSGSAPADMPARQRYQCRWSNFLYKIFRLCCRVLCFQDL